MVRFSFSSLRVRLIILVFLAVIPALGITLYSGLKEREQERQRALDDALEFAQEISKSHDRLIQDGRHMLFTLSRSIHNHLYDKDGYCSIFAELVKESKGYTRIFAAKPNGEVFASHKHLTQPVNFAERPWFKRLLKTRDFVIGEYQIEQAGHKPTIVIAYPVLTDIGDIKAILSIELDLEWLYQTVAQSRLPRGTSVSVIDSNGTILLRYPESEKFVGKSTPEESIVKAMLVKPEGVEETVGLDGVPRLFGFTTLGKGVESIHVGVGVPKQIALAEVEQATKNSLAFLGLIGALALIAAWFGGNFFVLHPVNRLLNVTKRLADGDLIARAGPFYGKGEIGQLAHAFDQMAEPLERREAEQKQEEEKLKHLNTVLHSIRNVNQLMVREKDPGQLLQGICDTLVNTRGYYTAWIILIGEDSKVLKAVEAGLGKNFFPMAEQLGRGELPGCIQKALIQSDVVLIENVASDCADCLLSLAYPEKLAMTARLEYNKKLFGFLTVSTPPQYYHLLEKEEHSILEELSGDIGYALYNLGVEENRKKAVEDLVERERKYRSLFNNSRDAIIIIDEKRYLFDVNKSALDLFGYTSEEMLGKNISEFYRDNAKRDLFTQEMAQKGYIKDFEDVLQKKDGTKIECLLTVTSWKTGDGNILGYHGIIRDVTEHKNLEAQLFQSRKMEAIGRLAGGIAHDFNNLLTVIQGYASFAMGEIDKSDPSYEMLKEISTASQQAANLTSQLLLFSRKKPIDRKPININERVGDLLKMLHRLIGEDINITLELYPGVWNIFADPGTIDQVMMNLVVNARDAMPKGGKITIKTENIIIDESYCKIYSYAKSGQFACLSVTDTGIGMNKEVIQKIFEPFFTTKGVGKGTGLGLSVVYGIVKEHDGWINVYSEPGLGTTFRIYLPAHFEKLKDAPKETVSLSLKELQGKGERILIVEDDKSICEMLKKFLGNNGYIVFSALNAKEALELFEREKGIFDLVVSDVVLPDKSGLELVEQLLSQKPELRILMSSGYMDDTSQWPLIKEKGYPFLNKPYSLVNLLEVIYNIMSQDRKESGSKD